MLGWDLNIVAGAVLAYRKRVDPEQPVWTIIGHFTRGKLLSPTPRT